MTLYCMHSGKILIFSINTIKAGVKEITSILPSYTCL